MLIDARDLDQQELFARLKEKLSERGCDEILIDVLVSTEAAAEKVKAFGTMSGCQAESRKEGDHYMVHLKGFPCCS